MKQNSNISVILPVHELNDSTKVLFGNAVQSVMDQVVLPNELVIVVSSILNNGFVSKQLSQLKLSKQVKYKSQLV